MTKIRVYKDLLLTASLACSAYQAYGGVVDFRNNHGTSRPPCLDVTGMDFWTCLMTLGAAATSDEATDDSATTEDENYDPSCVNQDERCDKWAEEFECAKNPNYMLFKCRKACSMCQRDRPDHHIATCYGVDQSMNARSALERASIRQYFDTVETYMFEEVFRNATYTEIKPGCRNLDGFCTMWAARGECATNPDYMLDQCAPACMRCYEKTYEYRCPYDKDAPGVWGPGDMQRFFERITTDPVLQQKHNVTVHFSPNDHMPNNTNAPAPWVVTLDHFLTDDECDHFVQLGHELGFTRSKDVGELQPDGTYGSKVNEKRTSTTAWFTDRTYRDPIARTVLDRMDALLDIPYNNSEYLQVLKYEVGQGYNEHHDFIPFQVNRPQGPRIITVFLYLNTVEAGGGTRFPKLDFISMPQKGRVLIWPSVLNHDPMLKDERTDHEAMLVEAGIKYGANAWVHLRDFKTSFQTNCAK